MKFNFETRTIDSSIMPIIMGIHNATPDSFSDGNSYRNLDESIEHCVKMVEDGADIIDIGGESTRPNSKFISEEDELSRVLPLVKHLKRKYRDIIISIDTVKSTVAKACLDEGADIINDISGLTFSIDMTKIISKYNAYLVIMHNRINNPGNYVYKNLVEEIKIFLKEQAEFAVKDGVLKSKIILDPGVGGGFFGKNSTQSIRIISQIQAFKDMGYPILLGASRKGFIGELIGEKIPRDRVCGDLGVAAWAFFKKIDILRVHDVKATKQLFKTLLAINDNKDTIN